MSEMQVDRRPPRQAEAHYEVAPRANDPRPRVLVVRGHMSNTWELRPWEALADDYDVTYLQTGEHWNDTCELRLNARHATSVRDLLPPGRLGDLLLRLPGDRYLRPRAAFEGFDIVHAKELGAWFAAQAAALKDELGYKLVLSASETIPGRETYRNIRTRPYRRRTLERADRFFATTERAALCLCVEGVEPQRIRVLPSGVDVERFAAAPTATRHTILSPGRLVWEKGHQDVLRAVAAIRRGAVASPVSEPRVVIVGRGRERARLQRYAADLGIADLVELRDRVPYAQMPGVYAAASCVVLGSIPTWSWEEQFGMVLAEGMAAGLAIVAARSGSIPEVCGPAASYFNPGDWLGLAHELARGPLSRDPAHRATPDPERVRRYSAEAQAQRLTEAYDELLGRPSRRYTRGRQAAARYARS